MSIVRRGLGVLIMGAGCVLAGCGGGNPLSQLSEQSGAQRLVQASSEVGDTLGWGDEAPEAYLTCMHAVKKDKALEARCTALYDAMVVALSPSPALRTLTRKQLTDVRQFTRFEAPMITLANQAVAERKGRTATLKFLGL